MTTRRRGSARRGRDAGHGLLDPASGRGTATPPRGRRRSWALIVVAALFVVGSGLAVAAWGLSAGDRVSVLAVAGPVAKGAPIDREDLVSVSVSGVDGAVAVADASEVIGKRTVVQLVEGQILTDAMLADKPLPGPGQSMVGLALEPSRVPGSLEPGDIVDVVATPPTQGEQAKRSTLVNPQILAEAAEVDRITGDPTPGGQMLVTIVVGAGEGSIVAAYSTQGQVALVEVPTDTGRLADESGPGSARSGDGTGGR